jgi:hypothetical protein
MAEELVTGIFLHIGKLNNVISLLHTVQAARKASLSQIHLWTMGRTRGLITLYAFLAVASVVGLILFGFGANNKKN